MTDKLYGDLNVFGVVSVGVRTDGSSGSYTLPYTKGVVGDILATVSAPISTGILDYTQWTSPSKLGLATSSLVASTSAQTLSLANSYVTATSGGIVSAANQYTNSLVADTSSATLTSANLFALSLLSSGGLVGITGQNGIYVTQVGINQFIISLYTQITSNLSVSPSLLEIGQTVNSVNLNWSYNKPAVVSQSLDHGIGSLPINLRSYNFIPGTPITSNTSFILNASDGIGSTSDSATIEFRRKRYWGTIPSSQNSLPTNSQLLAKSSELSTSRGKTITYNCATPSGGNYFYYCYPTSYGQSNVSINNLSFNSWFDPLNPGDDATTPVTVSVTGQYGHVENYYMYRVFNPQNGSAITVVYG